MEGLDFGDKLSKIRLSKNINKLELSRKSNISDAYLHRIEKKEYLPSPKKFIALLEGLRVNLDELEALVTEYYKANPGKIREFESLVVKSPYITTIIFNIFYMQTVIISFSDLENDNDKTTKIEITNIGELIAFLIKHKRNKLFEELANKLFNDLDEIATLIYMDDTLYLFTPSFFKLLNKISTDKEIKDKILISFDEAEENEINTADLKNLKIVCNFEHFKNIVLSEEESIKQLHKKLDDIIDRRAPEHRKNNIKHLHMILDSITAIASTEVMETINMIDRYHKKNS